jgi:hypothetical protein
MVRAAAQSTGRLVAAVVAIVAGAALGGCAPASNSSFVTNTEGVQLHSMFDENGAVTALLARGTPVERVSGGVSSSCECWLVSTPAGTGWVYTRYLELQMADLGD